MRIPHSYPTFPQSGVHRPGVHAESFADPHQRPALAIQPRRLVDLRWCEPLHPHPHPMALQDLADRLPGDPEPISYTVAPASYPSMSF